MVKNQEENYDIKYTSEEKKIEGQAKGAMPNNNVKEKEEEEKELLNKFHGDPSSQSNKNQSGLAVKGGNMEESFSSFGNKAEGAAKAGVPVDHTSFLKHVNSKKDKEENSVPSTAPQVTSNNNAAKSEAIHKDNVSSVSSINANNVTSSHQPVANNTNVNTSIQKSNKNYEDSTLEGIGSARKISDEDIKNATTLLLEEVTGEVLKNNKLKINAGGLSTGLRKARDGVAFFGKVIKIDIYKVNYYILEFRCYY
jgi:hypothetical protein